MLTYKRCIKSKCRGGKAVYRLWLVIIGLLILTLGCTVSLYQEEVAPQVVPLFTATWASTMEPALTSTPLPALTFTPESTVPSIPPAIPEKRLLIVEWPKRVRVGDSALVRLSLEMDDQGTLTPTAFVEGEALELTPVEIPNLYETHRVIAQARLDLAGVQVAPEGVMSEQLLPGMPTMFIWSVQPTEVGDFLGTIWLHLVFIPNEGGSDSRLMLSAQNIDIRAVDLLGLGGRSARILGAVGSVLGGLISLDNLLQWGFSLLKKRMKKGAR